MRFRIYATLLRLLSPIHISPTRRKELRAFAEEVRALDEAPPARDAHEAPTASA